MDTFKAYVFIVSEIGKEKDLIGKLRKFSDIKEIRIVYGDYDIVLEVTSDNFKKLNRLIMSIRQLPEVLRTVTLVSAETF